MIYNELSEYLNYRLLGRYTELTEHLSFMQGSRKYLLPIKNDIAVLNMIPSTKTCRWYTLSDR